MITVTVINVLINVLNCLGALAAVCFILHWMRGKETLERWHSRVSLRNLHVIGFVSAVAGVTALIWYLFLTFYYKIRKHTIDICLYHVNLFARNCAICYCNFSHQHKSGRLRLLHKIFLSRCSHPTDLRQHCHLRSMGCNLRQVGHYVNVLHEQV